ncbi:MAG: guanylate kinase [Gemmatimonadaceae bacterium]|nr:guanylate kinase [Gemmatimonadaceae bacterium]
MSGRPFPIVLSAPSGGGKTTIARRLLERRSDVGYSVSCTTRAPRAGEVDGQDYHFLSRAAFDARVERGEFAEWAEVHGNRYGTLRAAVRTVLEAGRHVMLDIDVQGARQVTAAFPEALTVFIIPPSVEVLVARLLGRKSESEEALALRLRNARTELMEAERYQYVVVNDDLEHAVQRVGAIIDEESLKRERVPALGAQVDAVIAHLLDGLHARSGQVR